MTRIGSDWVLTAASVCFPSRWSLAHKVGRNLSAIHGPVPGYEAELARPTRAFFDRLGEDRPVWRLNWTLLTDPDLHQPGAGRRDPLPDGALLQPGRDVWLRVERQTLRRLDAATIAFTIRTYVTQLQDAVASAPETAEALEVALSGVAPAVVSYKGWRGVAPVVLEWLAGAGPGTGGA